MALTLARGSYEQLNKHNNTSEGFSRKQIYFPFALGGRFVHFKPKGDELALGILVLLTLPHANSTKIYLLIKIMFTLFYHTSSDSHTIFML